MQVDYVRQVAELVHQEMVVGHGISNRNVEHEVAGPGQVHAELHFGQQVNLPGELQQGGLSMARKRHLGDGQQRPPDLFPVEDGHVTFDIAFVLQLPDPLEYGRDAFMHAGSDLLELQPGITLQQVQYFDIGRIESSHKNK